MVIDEHGPAEFHFGKVRAHLRRSLEGHNRDLYSQIPERLLLLLQLQQVPAAGESTKVPVKDQQQPMSPIVAEPVSASLCVKQLERNRRSPRLVSRSALPHVHAFRHDVFGACCARGPRERVSVTGTITGGVHSWTIQSSILTQLQWSPDSRSRFILLARPMSVSSSGTLRRASARHRSVIDVVWLRSV